MRFSSALALSAASTATAFQDQKVLGGDADKPVLDSIASTAQSWMKPLEDLFGEVTSEAKGVWDEVSLLMPDAVEAFKQQAMRSKPKPATRRPDHEWDHIVKGAEVHDLWVNDESKTGVDSTLKTYNLRAKTVDPSKLGVDTVKQYSGYLDDEENDKHLFYCKFTLPDSSSHLPIRLLTYFKGSSSPETTPRMTPLSSGSTAALAALPSLASS